MKIGIDAKWYFTGPPSGTVVVRNLIDNLIDGNSIHTYYLFFKLEDKVICDSHFQNKKNVRCIFVKGRVNFLINLFCIQSLSRKLNLDCVLYQNFSPIVISSKIKQIVYIHDFLFLDYPQYFTLVEKIIYRLMVISAKKANHIITISESEKNRILNHTQIENAKVSVVYHGVDPVFKQYDKPIIEEIANQYCLPSEYILYIGRLNERKNIKTLLEGLSLLKSDIKLVVIGKEDHKVFELKKEAKKLQLENRILKLGYIESKDMAIILAGAKIFVFPSYAEGFGLPPLEAMKSGVPTITSKTTSLPEVCGSAAIYFNPYLKEELAQKLTLLLEDATLYSQTKEAGLLHAQRFSWANSSSQLLSILEKQYNDKRNN